MSEELQLEEQISQELVKQNVTQAVISGLKEKYAHLKISGIEDKGTYLLVKEGRKECKAFRVLAKKICEKGREDAVAIQKAWVKKQKEVTDEIAAIEDPWKNRKREYEAAVAKEKEERKRRQEEQLIMRQQVLTGMGALYSDGSFHLGEVRLN
jgi:formamidopyrimidine-DNA glycosylase